MTSRRRRIAFIVDRYAPSIFAGAPLHAFALAKHLGTRYDTELLTTTALDAVTWANALPAGVETIDGVTVRRFAVDVERDKRRFDRLSKRLVRGRPSLASHERRIGLQERWMALQGPLSLALLRYLAREREAYDAFVFVSYLYATTYFGLPLVADRALLLPLTHDEWAIRFSMWDRIFALPRGFAYNTEEERAFTARRFPHARTNGPVIGVGIDVPATGDAIDVPGGDRIIDVPVGNRVGSDVPAGNLVGAAGSEGAHGRAAAPDPERFRRRYGIRRPFALYLGRIDPSKGVPDLLRAFARAPGRVRRDLVLVGECTLRVPQGAGVHVVGPVDETTKWDALAACDLLVLPSRYESLSLVALEAWASGKAVLANARADAVAGQIARSGGGLTYRSDREFARGLDALDPQHALVYGARGRAYVEEHYRWPVIEERLATHLAATFAWPE